MNSVEDSIAQSIVYLDNALDVWNELKERFSHGDFVRISELQIEIYGLKQGSRSVSEFFTALKVLWEELDAYLPVPVCNCPHKCVCMTGILNVKTQHNLIRTIRFLTGLNDNFDLVRSQILLMDPLPQINKVFSMVIQHERQFVSTSGGLEVEDSKVLINASDAKRSQGRGRGSNNSYSGYKKPLRVCTYCGKDGHTVEICYKKHGYPPNFGKNASANSYNSEEHSDADDTKSSKGVEAFGLTKDQYEKLVNLLQTANISSNASTSAQVNVVAQHNSGITLAHSCTNSTYGSWIIDSGASDHICSSLVHFDSYHSIAPVQVRMPNGTTACANFAGTISLSQSFQVHNVLLVPEFSLNLISVPRLTHNSQCIVLFDGVHCSILEKKCLRMIGSGELVEGLYYLTTKTKPKLASANTTSPQTYSSNFHIPSQALWHFRLGHLSNKRLQVMQHDFPSVILDSNSICDICHYARHRKSPYQHSVNRAMNKGELIHFDIWGPISIQSIHGHKYFLTAVDDHSRFTWIILLKAKSEVSKLVQQFIHMIEKQFDNLVKVVRTDNGPEFLIPQFYASKGIIHQTSCVDTPQQNGRVERKHQHILNVGRVLLFQSKLPKHFWSYALLHDVYIINRVVTPLLQNKSPYLLLHDKSPDIDHLKVFGSLCYASTLPLHRTKLDPRARKCIFLGYKPGMKGVVLYDMNDKRIFVSRDVVHHEHILPYHSSTTPFHWTYHSTHSQPFPTHDTSHSHPNQPPTKTSVHTPNTIVHLPSNLTFHPQGESPTGFHDDSDPNQLLPPQATSPTLHDPHSHRDEEDTIIETTFSSDDLPSIPVTLTPEITTSTPEITTSPQPQPQETRKSTRIHNPPGYLSDYLCNHSNSITHESSSSG
jgi:hypothetical protein